MSLRRANIREVQIKEHGINTESLEGSKNLSGSAEEFGDVRDICSRRFYRMSKTLA